MGTEVAAVLLLVSAVGNAALSTMPDPQEEETEEESMPDPQEESEDPEQ